MKQAFSPVLLLAVIVAIILRCPQLDVRPLHNDEAVNAIKFHTLWDDGTYKYDPNEHHGPTLFLATWLWEKLVGEKNYDHITEIQYRAVTIFFGIAVILLLPLVADGLGRGPTAAAAFLAAISPAMVFYSRYYIHEMLLLFFTMLAIVAGWRYYRSRLIGWAIVAGIAIGLMQATKETFVLTLAAASVAIGIVTLHTRKHHPATMLPFKPWHFAAAIAAWIMVAIVFFSWFFTNASGPLDSIRTYLPWLHRAEGHSPHIHPWGFYLERLAWFHPKRSPAWSEGLIIILAFLGMISALRNRHISGTHTGFLRFLSLYSLILTVIYSSIAYKTPWCLLSFWIGFILMAGVGVVVVLNFFKERAWKISIGIALLVASSQLAAQSRRAAIDFAADPRNPYVYAQTSRNVLEMLALVNEVTAASPQHKNTIIKIVAPGDDYWPLPWYLRDYENIGYWNKLPDDPYAPIMIVASKLNARLDDKKTHVMAGLFELRPSTFLELYVNLDLWRATLAARLPKTEK